MYGCVAFIHIPKKKCVKLDAHNEKFIFVEYSNETKGFHFYNLASSMITINIDAKFIEHHYWHTLSNFTTLVVFFEALMNQLTSIQVIDPVFTPLSSVFATLSTVESFMPTSLPLHLKVSTSTFTFSTYDFSPISPPPTSSNSSKSTSTTKLIGLHCSTHYISPTIGCWNMLFMWSSLMTSSHVWLPWMNHVSIKM